MPHNAVDLAHRFIAAVESGDLEGARACYAPNARIWHNTDGLDFPGQTVEENLRVLAGLHVVMPQRRYAQLRISPTPEGYAQQHVLSGVTTLGEAVAMPAAIFCTVVDGRITRLDEYFREADASPLARAFAALQAKA